MTQASSAIKVRSIEEATNVVVQEPSGSGTSPPPQLSASSGSDMGTFLVKQGDAMVWLWYRHPQFAILQVSRGIGPRALEQWMARPEGVAKVWCDEDDASSSLITVKKNEKPQVHSPHYRAYLQSLVLVIKDKTFLKEAFLSFTLTVEAIIQGKPDAETLERLSNQHNCRVEIQRSVPSNTAGILSHVSLTTVSPPVLPSKFFRRHLEEAGFPILGKAEGSRSFRGHRLLMATVRLKVVFKTSNNYQESNEDEREQSVVVEIESPALFATLLDKEERFWQQRNPQRESPSGDQQAENQVSLPRAYEEGQASFAGLTFVVTPHVMIPRPGSETVIESAKTLWCSGTVGDREPVILDLGTGSGCLLLTLLQWFPHGRGYGVDASADALAVAEANAQRLLGDQHGTRSNLIHARFADVACPEKVDLIVCNPPYHIPGRRLEAATLQYEPREALFVDEGCDGLFAYREAWSAVIRHAAPGAVVAMEVCRQNFAAVYEYLQTQGLQQISVARDAKRCIRSIQGRLA